jgi:hypothetical protein
MRQIPDLEFRDDRSMEHAEEIGRVLRGLRLEQDPVARPAVQPAATTEDER